MRIQKVVPSLLFAALLPAQNQVYRDPGGRFSVPVPAGWTATPAGEMLQLKSGDAYAIVIVLEGGGEDPRRVARFTDDFGQRWQGYKRLNTGTLRVGNVDGAYAIYSGTNPKGVDAVVKAVSAPLGSSAVIVIASCPVAQWSAKQAAIEGIVTRFTVGRESPPQQPAQRDTFAPPPGGNNGGSAVPPQGNMGGGSQSRRQLPQGFSIKATNGGSGQALAATFSAEFNGRESATKAFRGIFGLAGSYFDSPPQLVSAVADAQDKQVQAFFRAVWNGARVRGLMVLTVENGRGYSGLMFDREDLFGRSLSGMSRQMAGGLGAGPGGGGPAMGGAPRRPAQLMQTPLPDGSGAVGLPAGWRIAGYYKGTVDILGPSGESANFGGYNVVYSQPVPGTPPTVATGPYRPPAAALALHYDVQLQRAISRGATTFRVLEQAQTPSDGGQAAYISFLLTSQGQSFQGLAMVSTKPVDATSWMYYMSVVGAAPPDRFAAMLPTMWEMWKSWSVNPAVYRERMDQALQSMRDTYKIIQGVNDNRQRASDNVNTAWSQVMRGVTTVEDVVGQRRGDFDTGIAEDVVRHMNAQGYQYRVVPLQELTR
jgi:hypothetical protein